MRPPENTFEILLVEDNPGDIRLTQENTEAQQTDKSKFTWFLTERMPLIS